MLKNQLKKDLKQAVSDLGFEVSDIVISIPQNFKFGDYSTNLALQLAKLKPEKSNQTPTEIANQIKNKIENKDYLERVEVAGAGFLNFFVKNDQLVEELKKLSVRIEKDSSGKKILIEYGHVNLLKEIHIGHLRTFILGESLARILQSLGNEIFRANYQGDIGLHIAKAIWGIQKLGLPTSELDTEAKAEFLGKAYAEGNKAYDEDPNFKTEIDQINNKLYQNTPGLVEIYQLARRWSLEYFEPVYELLGVSYDRCFFESEVAELGKTTVLKNIGKVFEKNDGAVIFPGEKYGLHTRVFLSSAGNPTYEAKEVGLAKLEYDTFNYDKSIHVVADEQTGYFQVVIKAIELIYPYLTGKKYHLAYGFVDLKSGKMSSRTGNVVTVDELIRVVSEKVREIMKGSKNEIDQKVVNQVAIGAIKFSYLKFSPRPNMVFDLEESVSLQGDSGPYVQYAFTRTQSILKNAGKIGDTEVVDEMTAEERALILSLEDFSDIVTTAASELKPNLICEYLVNLAHLFNLFYQKERVIGSKNQNFRLLISQKVGETLKEGLGLLGIDAPERM